MTDDEFKMMPIGFIRKYGSYISNMRRYEADFRLDENKNQHKGYFDQVRFLKKIMTDEEKQLMIKEFQKTQEADVVSMKDLERERGDYMRRQPRVHPDSMNYNFEEYGRYSKMLR